MAAHHCPKCRVFSWHEGALATALRCPACGLVAAQVPNETDLPPLPLPGSPIPAMASAGVIPRHAELEVARHVGGGWYELPDGQRVRGREQALAALEDES